MNQMKNLEKLTLLRYTPREVSDLTNLFCPTLKSFKIYEEFPHDILESFLKGFPNLEDSEFIGCAAKIPDIVSKFNKKLKILKLDPCSLSINLAGVSMPNLMELEINCYQKWSILVDFNFFESFPNVKKITIKG